MSFPTVTVIIPNYNHGKYLFECLTSVFYQTVKPSEIIVIDDASTDNSVDIIRKLIAAGYNIKLFQNPQNMGAIYTLNKGIELATSEYIYLGAADDFMYSDLIEKELNLLHQFRKAGLCFSNPTSFNDKTKAVTANELNLFGGAMFFDGMWLASMSAKRRVIIAGSSIVKTEYVKRAGGLKPELKWHCDFFLMFTIAFRHGVCYIPETLNMWRSSKHTYMTRGLRDWKAQHEVVKAILELLSTKEYSDVVGQFVSSGVLANCPRSLLTLVSKRKYWAFLSWPFIRKSIPQSIFWSMPYFIQNLIRRIKN